MLGVVGFHGVVHAIPFDGNYTSEMFEHAIKHIVLPSLPRDSYVMMDNARGGGGGGGGGEKLQKARYVPTS